MAATLALSAAHLTANAVPHQAQARQVIHRLERDLVTNNYNDLYTLSIALLDTSRAAYLSRIPPSAPPKGTIITIRETGPWAMTTIGNGNAMLTQPIKVAPRPCRSSTSSVPTPSRALLGNHERKHVKSYHGEVKADAPNVPRARSLARGTPMLWPIWKCCRPSIELDEAVLVHGFFEPDVPLASQRETVITGVRTGAAYLEKAYRVHTDATSGEKYKRQPWFTLYDGHKPLVFGHKNYTFPLQQPLVVRDRVYGIDTGCCNGHYLTGLLLPEFRFLQVRSHDNYYRRMQKRWSSLHPGEAIGAIDVS